MSLWTTISLKNTGIFSEVWKNLVDISYLKKNYEYEHQISVNVYIYLKYDIFFNSFIIFEKASNEVKIKGTLKSQEDMKLCEHNVICSSTVLNYTFELLVFYLIIFYFISFSVLVASYFLRSRLLIKNIIN